VTRHELHPEPGRTTDVFDRDAPPVLTVDPGDTVVAGSLDAAGFLERQHTPGEQRPTMFDGQRGHCLTGPIEVRGAEPGNVLAVRVVSAEPGEWGWTVAGAKDNALNRALGLTGAPTWLLWEIDAAAGTATSDRGHTVRTSPFLGVIGMPPDEPGRHSTIPPRSAGGGNIDCRDLTAGATLFLPVTVPGALLHLGDGHAAQGDGEVSGTAIECPMTTEVVLDVVTDAPVPGLHAVTPHGRITFGFDADLNAAMAEALAAMVTWMQSLYDVDRGTATALASSVVNLRVTQVVNEAWGVHALLAHGAIT
jgi:acetamidase/formamidase